MRKRITRKYPMSDAMLVLFVRLMITRLLRDLAVLGAKFGLTNAKLTELGTECTAFDEMPVDTDERADITDVIVVKDALRKEIYNSITDMQTRVKGKWGIHSRQYVRVQDHAANLDHCADELFVRKSKSILRLMTQWLADLANEAQTATEITETTAKLAEFLEMLTDVDAETGDRREKSEDRVIAGNALYDTTMIYLGYGFEHYSKTGEAKVDDYILQKFLGNGASTLPDIPGGLRYDMVEQKAFWEDTETETSYEIEITENGVVTQIFIGQNVTEYAIAMGATAKEMRIRSRNAAGVSGWTPKVIIPPVAQPAKPSNLIFTPAAGSNDASISATRPAGAVAMIVGYAADGHPMSELGYMTEEGVYVWNPWLTPGTYYVRAEYPGGILSDWETLHIT